MKVQYQLVDAETKKAIPIGCEFELVDFMKEFFDKGEPMSWWEASVLFGDPMSNGNPVGILGVSPIEAAREAVALGKVAEDFNNRRGDDRPA